MQKPYSFTARTGISVLIIIVLISVNTGFAPEATHRSKAVVPVNEPSVRDQTLYEELQLAGLGLDRNVFEKAVKGLKKLVKGNKISKETLLSVADMSQSANAKRLYVIDLSEKKVLFNTYVSNGRNTGEEFATSFGNKPQSYKSSLGFYATGQCYHGAHGLSLRLKGLEKGINHRAEQRGIVIHGADYVSESFIEKYGRLGRSQGCPAVPSEECTPIVNTIKEGTCFFVYYPDSVYFERSVICSR